MGALTPQQQTDVLIFLSRRNGEAFGSWDLCRTAIRNATGVDIKRSQFTTITNRLRKKPTDFYKPCASGGPMTRIFERMDELERRVEL